MEEAGSPGTAAETAILPAAVVETGSETAGLWENGPTGAAAAGAVAEALDTAEWATAPSTGTVAGTGARSMTGTAEPGAAVAGSSGTARAEAAVEGEEAGEAPGAALEATWLPGVESSLFF